jgi:hypothetical protein
MALDTIPRCDFSNLMPPDVRLSHLTELLETRDVVTPETHWRWAVLALAHDAMCQHRAAEAWDAEQHLRARYFLQLSLLDSRAAGTYGHWNAEPAARLATAHRALAACHSQRAMECHLTLQAMLNGLLAVYEPVTGPLQFHAAVGPVFLPPACRRALLLSCLMLVHGILQRAGAHRVRERAAVTLTLASSGLGRLSISSSAAPAVILGSSAYRIVSLLQAEWSVELTCRTAAHGGTNVEMNFTA